MALLIILLSVVLTVLAFALGFIIPVTNKKIKNLVNSIKLPNSKQMFSGAVILLVFSLIEVVSVVSMLFVQYTADWTSDDTSLVYALSQVITLTVSYLYISLSVALFKKSSKLLFVSSVLIVVLTVVKRIYLDTSSFSTLRVDYLTFMPKIVVMVSLLAIISAMGGDGKIVSKYGKVIKYIPGLLLLNPICTVISNILSQNTQAPIFISILATGLLAGILALQAIAFFFIFKAFIDSLDTLEFALDEPAVASTKEKWIVALSVVLFPFIVNRVSSISKAFLFGSTVVLAIFLIIVYKVTEQENAKIRKTALIITAIIVILICIVSTILPQNTQSNNGCGHPSCEENGPFPCYGKNNTCPNYTYCYKDLYCDKCD